MSKNKQRKDKESRINLQKYFATAGYEKTPREIFNRAILLSIIIAIIVFIGTSYTELGDGIAYLVIKGIIYLVFGIPLALLGLGLLFYIYTDFRITNRKNEIERNLPEFLLLTAANMRAGMPIDQALWAAMRPQFGILAKEIENVAKENMVGNDLGKSLIAFGQKYESKVLQRTLSILAEGLEAGSEIGVLLEDIAQNIQDLQTKRESMSANVTTYVIFIVFAVVVAAPLLFGIALQLLKIVHKLGAGVLGAGIKTKMGMSLSISTTAVSEHDFFIFCIVSLVIACLMASIIISTIKTGSTSDALKIFPVYAIIATLIFIVAQWGLGYVFAGII